MLLTEPFLLQALKERARKKKPKVNEIKAGSVIENVSQTRMLEETALSSETPHSTLAAVKGPPVPLIEEDKNTNNTSASQVRSTSLHPLFYTTI